MLRPRFNPTPSHLAEIEPLANGRGGASSRLSSNDEYRSFSTCKDCCSDHDHNHDQGETDEEAEEEERRRCGDVEAGGRGGRPCGVGGRRGIGRWDSAAMLRGSRPASPIRDDDESSPAGGGGGAAACPEGETDHHHHVMRADGSSFSTVVGLVAHSIADGISLGASSLPTPARAPSSATAAAAPFTPSSSLQLVVFIAIMLHKAPTAFALSSLLASSPANSRTFIRRALLIFSLAAPVGALVTYAILSLLGGSGGGGSSTEWYTGLALVFSGGTFLFVATHALREQEKREERKQRQAAASSVDELDPPPAGLGDKARLVLVLIGMVLPATLSRIVGHGHGHG